MAMNEAQRKARQAESRATQFGNDPSKLRDDLTETTTKKIKARTTKGGTTEAREITKTKFDKVKFDQAKIDFENRGGASGEVNTQSRGAGGGSFATQGDFGPGAIRLNTVTAVNSKVGGR